MHKYYYLLFQIGVTVIFALSSAQPVVILVHGSFASAAAWSRPGGDFFEALEKQALTLNHKLINFCWSSMPLESEIKKAGESLAKLIASYPAQEEIILIGHSHGGNVILAASSHLAKQEASTVFDFDKQAGIFVTKPLEDNLMHTFSLMHTTKTITPRHISKVFLLGTPIDTTKFTPDMTVIKNLILFYSDGDRIQSVLGAFNKTLPPHPGRINLKVEISPLDQRGMAPSHSELHDTSIAHWILYIPEKLQQLMVGNFNKCCYGKDGLVIFQSPSFPIFQPIT